MEDYIKERIKYLKTIELDYFDKSCSIKYDVMERQVYRNFSNEFQARRNELEHLLTHLNTKKDEKRQTNNES